jgi:immunoglobulin-binding protein 1
MDSNSRSLQDAFAEAGSKRAKLDEYPSTNAPDYQAALTTTLATYTECQQIIDHISLFSPNESLEDITSSELQYLLLDYYLAELTLRRTSDIHERWDILEQSSKYFESFLKRLDSYDILDKTDERLWERYRDNPSGFAVVNTTDATQKRADKIARFKAEKELKTKLKLLNQDPKILEHDDDALRKLRLVEIALHVHETFQALESTAIEFSILAQIPKALPPSQSPEDDRNRGKTTNNYTEKLDAPLSSFSSKSGPILDKSGKPLRPFTLLDSRQSLRKGVFRPDHSLPTMSIDEYLEEERKRGGIIEGGGEKSGIKPHIDEDDHEKQDEETSKAREWDEFKDENARGSGNTLNRG